MGIQEKNLRKRNFPTDQKKFATIKFLKAKEGRKSNINQLLHNIDLTRAQRANFVVILHEMKKDGWILIEESLEHSGTKMVILTDKGSAIQDSVKKLLDDHPELKTETKVFHSFSRDEQTISSI